MPNIPVDFLIGEKVICDRDKSVTLLVVKLEASSHGVQYYCSWWDSGKIYNEWFDSWRLQRVEIA